MSSPKLKVSRDGKVLGDYTLEEILEGIQKGIFGSKDYFWDPLNKSAGWQKLNLLKSAGEPSKPKPPTPPQTPAQPRQTDREKPDSKALSTAKILRLIFGLLLLFVGFLIFSSGFLGNPGDSAIRQGVLEMRQTNGLLILIIGLLIARK